MKDVHLLLNWQGGQFKFTYRGETMGNMIIGGVLAGAQFRYRDGPWEPISAEHFVTCLEYGLQDVMVKELRAQFDV